MKISTSLVPTGTGLDFTITILCKMHGYVCIQIHKECYKRSWWEEIRVSSHLRINPNNIERAGIIAHMLKLEDLHSSVQGTLVNSQSSPRFLRFPCETLSDPDLHGSWYIPVLTCASLYLIISVHVYLFHKAVSFLKTEAFYRKLNLKTIHKWLSEFSISRVFKNSCLGIDLCRAKGQNQMNLSRHSDLKVCFKRNSFKNKIRNLSFGYPE